MCTTVSKIRARSFCAKLRSVSCCKPAATAVAKLLNHWLLSARVARSAGQAYSMGGLVPSATHLVALGRPRESVKGCTAKHFVDPYKQGEAQCHPLNGECLQWVGGKWGG